MEHSRVYTKRATDKSAWSGRIGHVTLFAPDGEWQLDGNILPESSVRHLLNFSLQTLQDAYAGAASLDEAIANWEKKRQKLIEGTLGERGGDGEEPIMVYIRAIVRGKLSAASKTEYEAIPSDDQAARADWLTAKFESLSEEARGAILLTAEEEMEADRKKRERRKALSTEI